jgi:protein-disulfide isomerase
MDDILRKVLGGSVTAMSKQFWAVIAIIVVIFVGVFAINGHKSSNNSGNGNPGTTHHVEGSGTSGVTLVEYGDYQCPYCQEYYQTVKQVVADYGDQITFQFVNFPLTSMHQNAFAAARAAEAAGKQGKYWQMHDILYENNDPTGASGWVASTSPTTYFNQYAKQIGLNVQKFKADYASQAVNNAINADMAKGNKLGVDATPTFYINDKKQTLSNTPDAFHKAIDAVIKTKSDSKQ